MTVGALLIISVYPADGGCSLSLSPKKRSGCFFSQRFHLSCTWILRIRRLREEFLIPLHFCCLALLFLFPAFFFLAVLPSESLSEPQGDFQEEIPSLSFFHCPDFSPRKQEISTHLWKFARRFINEQLSLNSFNFCLSYKCHFVPLAPVSALAIDPSKR